jgi:hypothetical protein
VNDNTLLGALFTYCLAFIDDILFYSNSLEKYLTHLKDELNKSAGAIVTINLEKLQFCCKKIYISDYQFAESKSSLYDDKVRAVREYAAPEAHEIQIIPLVYMILS